MLKHTKKIWLLAISLALIMTACKSNGAVETQVDPQAVFTAAAETANAKMTEMAAITPTEAPPTPTGTSTVAAEPSSTPTLAGPTATLTQPALVGNLADRAEFVTDVTIPDFTVFTPNQAFTKTWRLKNVGTSTWTTAYSLVFYSGTQMGGAASTSVPKEVKPGETIDLSVNLVSPAGYGQYTGYWILRNPLNKNFGVGANADQAFYVIINVAASGTVVATLTPTVSSLTATPATPTGAVATPTNTVAAPTSTGNAVGSVALNAVGSADFTGDCASNFLIFQILIGMTQNAQVSYNINVNANPEFQYTLQPGNQTNVAMTTGDNTRGFEMHFTTSGNGQVTVQVTSPNSVNSNSVAFSVTCQP